MSWRVVVINSHCKLDLQMNNMVIRKGPDEVIAIYLSEIAVVVIENTGVSITAALLAALIERKIRVVFCDEKHNPISELHPYHGAHDANKKLRNQISWTIESKSETWSLIAKEKIKNQSIILRMYGHIDAAEKLCKYANDVILSAINREIVAAGYFTQIGVFHNSIHNHFNFGCDLQEVFRPIVDRKVRSMELYGFGPKEKQELLSIVDESLIINGKSQTLFNAIGIYVRSVLDFINRDSNEIYFPVI